MAGHYLQRSLQTPLERLSPRTVQRPYVVTKTPRHAPRRCRRAPASSERLSATSAVFHTRRACAPDRARARASPFTRFRPFFPDPVPACVSATIAAAVNPRRVRVQQGTRIPFCRRTPPPVTRGLSVPVRVDQIGGCCAGTGRARVGMGTLASLSDFQSFASRVFFPSAASVHIPARPTGATTTTISTPYTAALVLSKRSVGLASSLFAPLVASSPMVSAGDSAVRARGCFCQGGGINRGPGATSGWSVFCRALSFRYDRGCRRRGHRGGQDRLRGGGRRGTGRSALMACTSSGLLLAGRRAAYD